MTLGAFRYVPGSAVAVVHGRTAVLLDVSGDDPVVARVAALVEAGGGVDDVLDALVTSGLKRLADFGAFEVKPDGVRLVVRGKVTGSVGETAGLNSEHTMWHDTWRPAATDAGLAVAGSASNPKLVIRSGVVLAAGIAYTGESAAGSKAPVAEGAKTSNATTSNANPEAPEAAQPPDPDTTHLGGGGELAAPEPSPVQPVPVQPVQVEPVPVEPVPVEPVVEAEGSEAGDGDEFAHLFGATQRPPALAAEPEPPAAEPPAAVLPATDPGATMAAPLTMPATELPQQDRPVETVAPGLITGMPWSVETPPAPAQGPDVVPAPLFAPASAPAPVPAPVPVPAPAPAPVAPPAEQGLDRTVNRSALVGVPGAVMVVAARCAEGHLSPAYAGACRVCGAPIPPQQPVEMPRPTLGQLRLSTGGVVPLDRPLILGRNPRIPPGYAAEQPNLVRLPDPEKDVSGQHLEVTLDYWNVVVRDLGSTNGTEVILPGEMPVALRANDPVIIEPGSRVVLAGVISFTFEVLS